AFSRDPATHADDEVGEEIAAVACQPALLFLDLDGARRAVPLAAIDRVEPASTSAVHHTGGRLRLSIDGGMIPLAVRGDLDGRRETHIIRLRDGTHEIGYAIAEALDIVDLPLAMAAAHDAGPIAGVIALGD